ncbi:hypothetical protein U1Q18_049904 [Sarracenia purpurea var. burkii]
MATQTDTSKLLQILRHSVLHQSPGKLQDLACVATAAINYVQTARNLLDSDALSGEAKYRIACAYCFVEDIERFVSRKHKHPHHPLVNYWNCRMEGETNTLINEAALLKQCYNYDMNIQRSAFDYLWKYLTDDEQIELILEREALIHNSFGYALCTLKERQFEYLVESYADHVFITLYFESETLAHLFWNHIKNTISVDLFYALISDVRNELRVVSEIWASAPDMLKKSVLTHDPSTFLQRICLTRSNLSHGYRDPSIMIESFSCKFLSNKEGHLERLLERYYIWFTFPVFADNNGTMSGE